MTAVDQSAIERLIAAFDLPANCRVDQRVPKKLLIENGAQTSADKRQINDVVEEILWLAALKPNTIGVLEYRDEIREYLEVAVLSLTLRASGDKIVKLSRLAELVHRAIPYPVILLLNSPWGLSLSMVHKRWAQNEAGKVVLDGDLIVVELLDDEVSQLLTRTTVQLFLQALPLRHQSQTTLFELYESWMDCLQAMLAANQTGNFQTSATPERAAVRRNALLECQRLELEAVRLRTLATKEKQMSRQIELNLSLKRVQAELAIARAQL
jgi:hypothetical protein